ncbi:hypothetical protein EGW08_005675 [Elysia chlorotica]|uniref:Kinesin motor domain-containing protein n=1 Tax=Elysia chlorotica TaxID=188477 RepID=A0A3S0ZZ12_ELYCH|nr:hypothetical protein EGW08_005675 [Elysia chlorotica]
MDHAFFHLLQAAFEGYNACMFAYGQTGTGKTYTMMGEPVTCNALFSHIDDCDPEDNVTFRIEMSFLEIYNERVRDLLPRKRRRKHERYTLKVREHPKEGPYVQDLSRHVVRDHREIQALIDRGNEMRTTASTHMHKRSSRSHAIVTINFSQARFEDDMPSEIVSKVHLVDLAGSERADPNYHADYKGRIKEGANINRSLVTLGNVIKALGEIEARSPGSSPARRMRHLHIPYRDSVLTWLLKDSLGGNSKTLMIATVSPASTYYGETISTLRYAQRAKSIVNKPKVNEDDNVRLIRELRGEIERLKQMLATARQAGSPYSSHDILYLVPGRDQLTLATMGSNQSLYLEEAQPTDPKSMIKQKEEMMNQLTQTWIDKWYETQGHEASTMTNLLGPGSQNQASIGLVIRSQVPHLVGMALDVLRTGLVVHELREGITHFGLAESDDVNQRELKGPEVLLSHCHFDNIGGEVTLYPYQGALCTVNGSDVDRPIKLSQGDTVLLGKTNMFTFSLPAESRLPIGLSGSGDTRTSWEHSSMLASSFGSLADLPSPVSKVPPPQMFNPSMEVESSFKSEVDRIKAAKERLEGVRREAERREEANQDMEEKLWAQHERQKDEVQAERIRLCHLTEAALREHDLAQADLQARRDHLAHEAEKYQIQLQQRVQKVWGHGDEHDSTENLSAQTTSEFGEAHSPLSFFSDGELSPPISGEIGAEIREKRSSVQGKMKDLAQREFLHTLGLRDSVRTLGRQEQDLTEEFEQRQEELQQRKMQISQREADFLAQSAVALQDIQTQKAEVEKLVAQQEQLELYLEEKQDLLYVGLDTPRPVRSAHSELVLNDVDKEQAGDFLGDFPSKTASTQELGDSGHFRKISGESGAPKRLNVEDGRQIWMKKDEQDSSEDEDGDDDDSDENADENLDNKDDDDEEEEEEEGFTDTSESDNEDDGVKHEKDDTCEVMDELDEENVMEQHAAVVESENPFSSINVTPLRHNKREEVKFEEEVNDLNDSPANESLHHSGEEFSNKHPNLSNTSALRSTGSGRPSRGRTRVQRMRPSALPPVDPLNDFHSSEQNLTDTAAAVTARLYQPPPPRDDLKGNYLKGSRERISSPLSSPVFQRKELNRDSPLRTLSSSSERDRESPPKHSFLRKGSKKQRTSPVHLPPSPSGRVRDKDISTVAKFDFLRKGSRKEHVAEGTKDIIDIPQTEVQNHDYLRRKDAAKAQGIPKKKVAKEEEDVQKHPYLHRKEKQYIGQPHERTKRQSEIPSHGRSHSNPTTKFDRSRLKTETELGIARKSQDKEKRRINSENLNARSTAPGHQIPSQEAKNRHKSDSVKYRAPEQQPGKRQREDRHTSHEPSSSSESLPKRKFLKKGSGKQPGLGYTPNFSPMKHTSDNSDKKPHLQSPSGKSSSESMAHVKPMHRSQSYPGTESFLNSSPTRSRTRLVSSTTSLASVPELSSEEERQQDMSTCTVSNAQHDAIPARRRRQTPKERLTKDMELRRHSHPEGDQLADALAQYTEQMQGGLGRERPSHSYRDSDITCSAGNLVSPSFSKSESTQSESKKSSMAVPKIVISSYDNIPTPDRCSEEKQKSPTDAKVRVPLKPKATNVKRKKQIVGEENKGAQSEQNKGEAEDNITSDILENVTKTILEQAKRDSGKHNESQREKPDEYQEDSQCSRTSSVADSDIEFSEDSLDSAEVRMPYSPDLNDDHINDQSLPINVVTTGGLQRDDVEKSIVSVKDDLHGSETDERQSTEFVPFTTIYTKRRNQPNVGADGRLNRAYRTQHISPSQAFHRAHSAPSRVETTYQADYVDHTHAAPELYSIKKRVRDLFAPSEDLLCTYSESLDCSMSKERLNDGSVQGHDGRETHALSERTKTLFRSSGSIPAYDSVAEFAHLDTSFATHTPAAGKPSMKQADGAHIAKVLNYTQSVPTNDSSSLPENNCEFQVVVTEQNKPYGDLQQLTNSEDVDVFPLHHPQSPNSTENKNPKQLRHEQVSRPGKLIQIGPNTFKLVSQESDRESPLERILTLDTGEPSAGPGRVVDAHRSSEDEVRWQSQLSEDDPLSSAQQQIQALQEVLQQLSPR